MPRSDIERRPTLLNSCASAATAAEARYRIDYPTMGMRASRIIALDAGAAAIVRGLAGRQWSGGHFLVFDSVLPADGSAGDAMLRTAEGAPAWLSDELDSADTVVMVATADADATAASVIGDACAERMVMSAGLVLSTVENVDGVVSALRPNAMVLVILKDPDDVPAILGALRV